MKGAIRKNLLTERIDIVKPLGWYRDSPTLTDVDVKYLLLYFEENRKDTQSLIVKMGYMLQKEERHLGGDNVSQNQTSIICIDLKSFYASVECVERGLDPFKANLVVADPTRSKSTICLAITPAMKALGIKNRCRIHEIPDCVKYITAMPRMQLYMDYSAKIYS